MFGRQVKHVRTGEIKTIQEYSKTGNVIFSDGTSGDIHWDRDPERQDDKDWVYIVEETFTVQERAFNQENLDLLRAGLVTIKIPDYNNHTSFPGTTFQSTINPILKAAGLNEMTTEMTWKYVFKHYIHPFDETYVDFADTVSEIDQVRNRKHLLIKDFYLDEPVPVEVSVNYEIY